MLISIPGVRTEALQLVAQVNIPGRHLATRSPQVELIDVVGENCTGEHLAAGIVFAVNQDPRVGRQLREALHVQLRGQHGKRILQDGSGREEKHGGRH
ncbi:MAG TPA: hypothetical protein PLF81_17395 [Candidatus Anammoximicrobium sp.]|nr:hypothetical protein [Candidatus Anammoximicrobium sp.]